MESSRAIVLDDLDRTIGSPSQSGEHEPSSGPEVSLPQADGGKDAWLFLAACFMVEAFVWGFPFSFGVFQEYYSTHEPFSSDPSGIAVIGTTATGVMYMMGVLLFPAYKRWPRLANLSKWAGLPVMATALIAGSFASKVSHMILTQGALYAVGGSMVYYPTLIFLDEWFIRRKGFAFGVVWAGTGAAGLTIPFVMNFILQKYGFRTALRVWAMALILISFPLIYFLRPRLPISPVSQPPRYGLAFLRTYTFWLLQMGLTVESLGYFIPSIYLPIFARSLGLSSSIGTLLIALVNAAAVFSTITMGMLIDRFHVTTVILLSSVGAAISVFLFWGLSTALPLLCVFSVLYGFFAGGFVSTNAGVIKLIKQRDETADVGTLIGLLSAGRGIGSILSGPLSEALMNAKPWQGEAGLVYGSGYGGLIVFTGVTAMAGGIAFGLLPMIADRLDVSKSVTILGQTASGGGSKQALTLVPHYACQLHTPVTTYGWSFSNAGGAVVRYIRIRMGKGGSAGKDAITISEGANMIFDHLSVSWGRDETFSINGDVAR